MFLHHAPVKSVNVRQLENDPSKVLRSAAEAPILVLKGDQPEASSFISGSTSCQKKPMFDWPSPRRCSRAARSPWAGPCDWLAGDSASGREDVQTLVEWLASS